MTMKNYVEEAKQGLAWVNATGFSNDDTVRKQELLAEAQVNAVLALVEQQRIANILSIHQGDEWGLCKVCDRYRPCPPVRDIEKMLLRKE